MKNWVNPEFKVLNLAQTAFGPTNPNNVDFVKYAVYGEDGTFLGWEEQYGLASGKPRDKIE
uniref:Uncharacterized protein n=1 Tax=Eubacterium cellulosolvens (strain ATCC 43171 / JCM 9499 / 6) TaxID=633697 RepID=I5AV47_EUBC6